VALNQDFPRFLVIHLKYWVTQNHIIRFHQNIELTYIMNKPWMRYCYLHLQMIHSHIWTL